MEVQADNGIPSVLLPRVDGSTWVLPLNCLAEVVAVPELSSQTVVWRGEPIPVLGPAQSARACAVLRGQDVRYWALPLAPLPLVYRRLTADQLTDELTEDAVLVAVIDERRCQVPDLLAAESDLPRAG